MVKSYYMTQGKVGSTSYNDGDNNTSCNETPKLEILYDGSTENYGRDRGRAEGVSEEDDV